MLVQPLQGRLDWTWENGTDETEGRPEWLKGALGKTVMRERERGQRTGGSRWDQAAIETLV